MGKQLLEKILKSLELTIVILLIIFSESFDFPEFLRSLISYATYGFLLLTISLRWKRFAYLLTKDKLLIFFFVFGIISFIWSENPSQTIEQLRFLIRATLFGAYLALQYESSKQIYLLSWSYFIAMIICVITSVFIPSIGVKFFNDSWSWVGIYPHKQTIGLHMGFASSIFIINTFDQRVKKWISLGGLLLSIFLIIMSRSQTGLVSFIFSLSLMPLYKLAKQRRFRGLMFCILLLIFSIFSSLVIMNLETIVVQFLGKNLEFNGRLPIWILAIEKALERPWLGYGYNGFWTSDVSNYVLFNTWAGGNPDFASRNITFHAHNGFIDTLLQLGIVGTLIFVLHFSINLQRIVNLILVTRKIENFWMFQFLGFFLVINLSEGLSILGSNIFWILYVSISLSSALEFSRIKQYSILNKSSYQLKIANKNINISHK